MKGSPTVEGDKNRFRAFHALYWSSFAFYQIYLIEHLTNNLAIPTATVGLIASAAGTAGFIAQPFWGMATDKVQDAKKVLTLLLLVGTALISTLPLHRMTLSAAVAVILIAFFNPVIPIIADSWIAKFVGTHRQTNYGTIRMFGSAAFVLVALGLGRLALAIGTRNVFFFHFLFALPAIVVANSVRFSSRSGIRQPRIFVHIPTLLRNREYVVFVLCAFVVFASFNGALIFMPLKVAEVGGDAGHLSIAWVIAAGCEVPILYASSRLQKRFRPQALITTAFCVFTLRLVLFLTARNVILIFAAQAMQGIAFGLLHSTAVTYVTALSPDEIKASALTIATGMYMSLTGIVSPAVFGFINAQYGLSTGYILGIGLSAAALLVFLLMSRSSENRNLRPKEKGIDT